MNSLVLMCSEEGYDRGSCTTRNENNSKDSQGLHYRETYKPYTVNSIPGIQVSACLRARSLEKTEHNISYTRNERLIIGPDAWQIRVFRAF